MNLPIPFPKIATLSAILFLALVSAATAQTGDRPVQLSMSIHTQRSEYWLGEPVELIVRIVNWHTPLAEISGPFTLSNDRTQLQIVRNGEIGDFYKSHYTPDILMPAKTMVKYGKAHEFRIIVVGDKTTLSGMAMETPGKYEFVLSQKMQLKDWARNPERLDNVLTHSRSLPIQVVAPPPEAAAALELLRSRPKIFLNLGRQICTLSNRSIMEQIVREYPKSRYAPHCLHGLANLSQHLGQSIAGQRQQAIEHFKKITSDYPDYILIDQVHMQLANLYRKTGQFNHSMEAVQAVVDASEDNLNRFHKSVLMHPFIGPVPNPNIETNQYRWYLFQGTRLTNAYLLAKAESGF